MLDKTAPVSLLEMFQQMAAATDADGAIVLPRILNYVWINVCHDDIIERDELCSVPLHFFDRAYENARRHPDVDVNIWVDYALLDDASRFFVDSYGYFADTPNVKLQNLRDIPAYAQSPLFKINMEHPIWCRVDYARLLVLQHCLETKAAEDVFYSDFDVADVALDHPYLKRCIDRFGCIMGKSQVLENGFMGFRRETKAASFLKDTLIPATLDVTAQGAENGYPAFKRNFKRWFNKAFPVQSWLVSKPMHNVLEPMGYKLPDNPAYTADKLCYRWQ